MPTQRSWLHPAGIAHATTLSLVDFGYCFLRNPLPLIAQSELWKEPFHVGVTLVSGVSQAVFGISPQGPHIGFVPAAWGHL